jgi:CHAT domain
VRFLIEVDRNWAVSVTGPGLERHGRMAALDAGRYGRLPAPADGGCDPEDPTHADCLRGAEAVRDAYEEVAIRREPSDPRLVARLGRYLFDALLGQETWKAIVAAASGAGAGVIELALAWDVRDNELHRMNWELLHDGSRYLAEGQGRADVTITRVVNAEAVARELDGPPRLLFAVGAALNDPTIRPGAEAIGLLRNVQEGGRSINARVLENASPNRLARAVAEFRPHAVHFISHGEVRDGQGVLLLPPDEQDQPGPQPRDARQLLQLLRVEGELPQLVVLSACESGPAVRLLGAHQTAPLAAQLVQGGVPVVVGMAGQVSDLACRLFTRSFGAALVGGRSLVAASAEARRAGLAGGALTSRSVDWAFPAVFMSSAVDPDWRPVPAGVDEVTPLVNGWISSWQVDEAPVFCSRTEFFELYWRMLEGDGAPVLAAFVKGQGVRRGRTRLLRELTKQALWDGHIPLLIGTNPGDEPPRTLAALRRKVEGAVVLVRRWLDLPQGATSQLALLRSFDPTRPPDDRLDPAISGLLGAYGEVVPEAVRIAFQVDLGLLAADARRRHPVLARGPGRVVVLLDGIDDGSVELVEQLHEQLLGNHGLGTGAEPVPVVLAFAYTSRDNLLRQIAEGQSGKPWLEVRELRAFQSDGEDLLAWEQVLLHPFNRQIMPGFSDRPWVFNRELDPPYWDRYVTRARNSLGGEPSVFVGDTFYAFLAGTEPGGFLKDADDETLLASLPRDGDRL